MTSAATPAHETDAHPACRRCAESGLKVRAAVAADTALNIAASALGGGDFANRPCAVCGHPVRLHERPLDVPVVAREA